MLLFFYATSFLYTMQFRNFDPNTNTQITPVELVKKIFNDNNDNNDTILKSFNIDKYLNKPTTTDITKDLLGKYNKIADSINNKVIKSKKIKKKVSTTPLNEYDEYINNKYPFINKLKNEKFHQLLQQRIKELIE